MMVVVLIPEAQITLNIEIQVTKDQVNDKTSLEHTNSLLGSTQERVTERVPYGWRGPGEQALAKGKPKEATDRWVTGKESWTWEGGEDRGKGTEKVTRKERESTMETLLVMLELLD